MSHKTYFYKRKKHKRHSGNIRHLGKLSLAIFLVNLDTTGLIFENLENLEFGEESTSKRSRF
jgi:hypothetical protein